MSKGNGPAHTVRIGNVKVTVWKNDNFYNCTISRSFKNDKGDWQDGDSFSHADLPVVGKAVDMATDWISAQ